MIDEARGGGVVGNGTPAQMRQPWRWAFPWAYDLAVVKQRADGLAVVRVYRAKNEGAYWYGLLRKNGRLVRAANRNAYPQPGAASFWVDYSWRLFSWPRFTPAPAPFIEGDVRSRYLALMWAAGDLTVRQLHGYEEVGA